jgi:CheY-like chemotaxis protein
MADKILVIEDDPITKRFYDFVFKYCELELIQSENPDEIFRILENENVRIVILDINLRNTIMNGKVISGTELSRLIKENEKFGNPKILLVSAYKISENDDEFINSKADGFILKPIPDFNEFLGIIRKLL